MTCLLTTPGFLLPLVSDQLGNCEQLFRQQFQQIIERKNTHQSTVLIHDRQSPYRLAAHILNRFEYPNVLIHSRQFPHHDIAYGNNFLVEIRRHDFHHEITVGNNPDRNLNATTLFDNKDNLLFPNQFVNIQLLVEDLKNQVVMPNSAVHRGAPNGVTTTFVYLVNPDGTVSVKPVTLGVVDGEHVAVTAGLAPGNIVVTEGGDRLRDGATVQLPGTEPTAAPRTAGAPGVPVGADANSGQQRGNGNGNGKWGKRHKSQAQGQPQNPPAQ